MEKSTERNTHRQTDIAEVWQEKENTNDDTKVVADWCECINDESFVELRDGAEKI